MNTKEGMAVTAMQSYVICTAQKPARQKEVNGQCLFSMVAIQLFASDATDIQYGIEHESNQVVW